MVVVPPSKHHVVAASGKISQCGEKDALSRITALVFRRLEVLTVCVCKVLYLACNRPRSSSAPASVAILLRWRASGVVGTICMLQGLCAVPSPNPDGPLGGFPAAPVIRGPL